MVWLTFDPQTGHEQTGQRPAFVVSPEPYNRKTGLFLGNLAGLGVDGSKAIPNSYYGIEIATGTKNTLVGGIGGRNAHPRTATADRFRGLVALGGNEYCQSMKILTVQEASRSVGDWLRRAVNGEQIAIHEGACAVLLQPLPARPQSLVPQPLSPREAPRLMQEESCLTPHQAAQYMREVREERLAADARCPA